MRLLPRYRRAARALTAVTLAGVLGASGAAPYISTLPIAAYADTQSELDAARAQLSEIGAEYQALQEKLQQAGAELEETASQIESTQQELDQAQKLLSQNVSDDYKQGNVSLIDILLSSTDFTDLISRVFYAGKVNDAQTEAIDQVKELQAQLEEQQAQQQANLEATQAQVDEQAANQARASALVASLSAELQAELEAEAAQNENLASGIQSAEDASNGASNVPVAGNGSTDNAGGTVSGGGSTGGGSSNNSNNTNNSGGGTQGGGSTPAPSPTPEPDPAPPTNSGGSATVSSPISYALAMAGQPYVSGGESLAEGGFDCSGLVYYAYRQIGITLPRSSGSQYTYFKNNAGRFTTNKNELQYGDVVFFPGHVAFYVGNGQVFGATRPGQVAGYGNINWYGAFLGGGQL